MSRRLEGALPALMSHLLWKCYWNNDVEKFRRLLAPGGYNPPATSKSSAVAIGSQGSPASCATSPRPTPKGRKPFGAPGGSQGSKSAPSGLGKAEVNSRDHVGLTILLRASSSTEPNAILFVRALLDHPAIDLYIQDQESGWNALHRALYAGNIFIARLLLSQERNNLTGQGPGGPAARGGQLIKTKDHEGNSPFDLYNCTVEGAGVKDISAKVAESDAASTSSGGDEARGFVLPTNLFLCERGLTRCREFSSDLLASLSGTSDEIYTFGSNKNRSLGVGDEDDRHFPERIQLKRPEHVLQKVYQERTEVTSANPLPKLQSNRAGEIPMMIKALPLHTRDVALSKFHTAILTKDPVSNLFVCGVGRGGRLGLGDENTHFRFTPVQGALAGKKVLQISLGQNHSLAIVDRGELWSWGSNIHSQLGYALPTPTTPDEEPVGLTPRQVFGPLRKEVMVGVASSSVHSVAHTASALYCWGRNLGQLALMDAEARSQEVQAIPRRVAASLISTPIVAVSAIDKATTCLLSSNTVFVFTSYGYNIVKFPAPDVFANARFSGSTNVNYGLLTQIKAVASGGESIAALSGRGDLFLMSLNHQADTNSSTSTTNPTKIKKSAISQPQCVWSARKDGVTSMGVGENGSVIICTESGAVWRRVKRAKAKDAAMPGTGDLKKKDFKFQRVPGITNAIMVRSSNFGAFSIVRKDRTSVADHIKVDEQTLWQDLAPLLSIRDFESRDPSTHKERRNTEFWGKELDRRKIGQIAFQVLKSTDLEADLAQHLGTLSDEAGYDAVVCTATAPNLRIPIHSWMLAARSPVVRRALQTFGEDEVVDIPETVVIRDENSKMVFSFAGLDIFTILNLVVYIYRDEVIPVWNYPRQVPHMAFRFRQIRVELMKLATKLGTANLEASARMQTRTTRTMDQDFRLAVRDPAFLESGDIVLELDGVDVPIHSQLACQRCSFFAAMFQGRSRGQWMDMRREELEEGERLKIELGHFDLEAFRYVLMHMYADVGVELFDETVAADEDRFSELVMEVMAMADELMLDRLSQICQRVIAKFVTTRNISFLLNEIGPYSVNAFKSSGLQYACMHLEAMLENHLLDDLEDDLMQELDDVVRKHQLARSIVARGRVADALLLEKYPFLPGEIEEEHRIRTREMEWKAIFKEEERKLAVSFRTKFGSLDDNLSTSPTAERQRRKSKAAGNESFSPKLRPMSSHGDLIFSMDEMETPYSSPDNSPSLRPANRRETSRIGNLSSLPSPASPLDRRRIPLGSQSPLPSHKMSSSTDMRLSHGPSSPPAEEVPTEVPSKKMGAWRSAALPTAKLGLRDIMSEASSSRQSAISAGLAAQPGQDTAQRPTPTKISQKERKRLQQLDAASRAARQPQENTEPKRAWEPSSSQSIPAPWKLVESGPKTSLKNVMSADSAKQRSPMDPANKPVVAAEAAGRSVPRRTASPKPDTRFSGQSRIVGSLSLPSVSSNSQKHPLVPHSKTYIRPAPKPEPIYGLTMSEIIGQQTLEQQQIRQAVAARPLEDIQREQEFQEWWDQESKRTQEEEARRLSKEKAQERQAERESRRGRRGRSGKRGGGNNAGSSGSQRGGAAESAGKGSGKGKERQE